MNILVVDDDAGSLRGMVMALESLGHVCHAYKSPAEALHHCCRDKFEAVITDLKMPTMNGVELMVAIHAFKPCIPVIIVAGCAGRRWAKAAHDRGAFACLEKPLDAEELAKILDKMANGK